MDGLLIVVSGFSGVGKGTLVKELLSRYPDEFALSVSATSRDPRPGEKDGEAYFFRTREAFEKMIAEGELLEYTEYAGNYYGTPRHYVEEQLKSGKNVILEIEVVGGLNVRKIYPEAWLMYVVAPTAHEVFHRLKGRGTESDERIRSRMERAVEETDFIGEYDCVLVNDDLEESLQNMYRRINEERTGRHWKKEMVPQLREEFKAILKEEF